MSKLLQFRGFLPYIMMVFMNAFVDLGHKIIIQNTVYKVYESQELITFTAIVNALILLPFIMFMSPAGFCADKFCKVRVMRLSAWAAVCLTLMITLFYYLGWFWPAFIMTFLLALQSAFYSPAKYGYIKELTGKENLASANGLVQATTTIAILAGIFVFTMMFEGFLTTDQFSSQGEVLMQIAPVGFALVAFSIIELVLAYRLPTTGHAHSEMQFDLNSYTRGSYLRDNLTVVLNREVIFLSIIGLAVFWSISQVMLAAFPAYAKETLSILDTRPVQGAMACAGIGIVLAP